MEKLYKYVGTVSSFSYRKVSPESLASVDLVLYDMSNDDKAPIRIEATAGQAVYFNQIFKNGKTQYVVKALSGQHIKGRDGQRHASRSFTELHQAEAFLARNGYKSSSR